MGQISRVDLLLIALPLAGVLFGESINFLLAATLSVFVAGVAFDVDASPTGVVAVSFRL